MYCKDFIEVFRISDSQIKLLTISKGECGCVLKILRIKKINCIKGVADLKAKIIHLR